MYRQISVHREDRHSLQTILWRDHINEPIQKFQLTTLTYGTAPASYVATKCLQMLAKEIEHVYPDVSRAIAAEFYMDDLLTGAESVEEAVQKRKLIQSTLDSAQLPLRKYISNSPEFISSLEKSLIEELHPLEFSSTGAAKILGLQWEPVEDRFSINIKQVNIDSNVLTKRVISSLAARVYDPLGFVTPVTIRAKILLQQLWQEGTGWDEPVSSEVNHEFRVYYQELHSLPLFTVPRVYCRARAFEKFELVGFCDASGRAYGAAVYIRAGGQSLLVCSKFKVAPVKPLTVPPLELLGAVLLTKLLFRVSRTLNYDISKASPMCDSTIVLAWLKGPSSKFHTFVRNRVDYVNSILPFNQWCLYKYHQQPSGLTNSRHLSYYAY